MSISQREEMINTVVRSSFSISERSVLMESCKQTTVDKDLLELKRQISILRGNIRRTLRPISKHVKRQIHSAKCRISNRDKRIRNLEGKYRSLKKLLHHREEELGMIKEILHQQSAFTMALGSTLSSLLWKASSKSNTSRLLVNDKNKLVIFFRTVAESLKSFRETYGIGHPLPNAQSNEVQFVVAVVGVVVNITTIAEGRKMILDSNEGRELIEEMINLTCELSVSGKYIQRVVLMALFNVSIDFRGTVLIVRNKKSFLKYLEKNIYSDNCDLKWICLKIVHSLTSYRENDDILSTMFHSVPDEKLNILKNGCSPEQLQLIEEITENLPLSSSKSHDNTRNENTAPIEYISSQYAKYE